MKHLISILCLLALATAALAQTSGLDIVTAVVEPNPRPGQGVTIRSIITNTFKPTAPLVVTATLSYIDGVSGESRTVADTCQVQVVHPLTLTETKVQLPTGVAFMANTAEVNSVVVPATVDAANVLTIPINKTINEGEFVDVLYGVKIP